MIRIENLTKNYGAKKALDDLNLTINDGEIFGLIGHNGAGKSTTIKSLVSIIEPTSGQIYFDGLDLKNNRDEIKKMIGYVPDSPDMFLKLPVTSYWKFIASVFGIGNDLRKERIDKLCQIFSMEADTKSRIEEYSHGMRQKVFLIGALISNPKIWVLDEPMTGLDPQAAYNLKELMKDHASQGNTVLFSTHVLEVAEQLCDRIGILSKGKILFVGTMDELRAVHPGRSLEDIYLSMVNQKPQDPVDGEGLSLDKKDLENKGLEDLDNREK
ncbi:ABC transporter ATP-binding protein [Peptostreptococcus stomatis]|uniref:ABC transporter ATP-binding protein n=1 Tax=Peptostreptococcus stomatis TaxID=341694 RepID=UPI0028D789D1|nr:ABC transporter ATP-binding protein [Peptostreptococcus stomatis]